MMDAQNSRLEGVRDEAYANEYKAEMAAADFAEAEKTMKSYETALAQAIAMVEAQAVPSAVLAEKDAELALEAARNAANEAWENYYPLNNRYYNLKLFNSWMVEDLERYSTIISDAQQNYDDKMLALEEAATALQEILDEKYDSYVAMVEKLNTISESYKETSALQEETDKILGELEDQISALKDELKETGKLEKAIKAHEDRIAELETYVAALLDGTTIEAAIAALEHENEMLKEALEAHQIILEALHAELENLLGVETEDSPVQE